MVEPIVRTISLHSIGGSTTNSARCSGERAAGRIRALTGAPAAAVA
jgi:hypothetical protein